MAKRKKSLVREYSEIIVLAVGPQWTFFIQAFRILGVDGGYALVGIFANSAHGPKLPFDVRLPAIRNPKPGDHIFRYPGPRSITSGGVAVEGRGGVIDDQLYVDGVLREEPFTKYVFGSRPDRHFGPFTVPAGHIFMMGDNRDNSADSRAWGPLDKKLISGKAMFIYFSWNPRSHSIRFSRIGDLIQ
jgi:signal peptidase I